VVVRAPDGGGVALRPMAGPVAVRAAGLSLAGVIAAPAGGVAPAAVPRAVTRRGVTLRGTSGGGATRDWTTQAEHETSA
jgi:hypothetical protein